MRPLGRTLFILAVLCVYGAWPTNLLYENGFSDGLPLAMIALVLEFGATIIVSLVTELLAWILEEQEEE